MDIQEKGRWSVSNWRNGRVAVQSDDFNFDAALEVSGNFESLEIKRAYAEEICRRLNALKAPNALVARDTAQEHYASQPAVKT